MAIEQTYEAFSGNDITLKITVKDEDTNEVLNLSAGVTALEYAIAAKSSSSTKKVSKTLGSGITIVDGEAGLIHVVLTKAEMEPLKDKLYHELRMVKDGKTSTLLYGDIQILENLIRT